VREFTKIALHLNLNTTGVIGTILKTVDRHKENLTCKKDEKNITVSTVCARIQRADDVMNDLEEIYSGE